MSFASVGCLSLISSILTARLFGIEVVGEWALVMAPVGALWLLSTVRGQAALVRELTVLQPRAPRVTGLFVAVLTFSTALTVLMGLILGAIAYVIFNGPVGRPELFAPAAASILGYTCLTNVSFNLDGVMAAFVQGQRLLAVRVHEAAAFAVGIVVASFLTASVWGPVGATFAAAASALVHRLVVVRPIMRFRVPRSEIVAGFKTLPELVRFAAKMAPGTLFAGLSQDTGTWVLGVVASIQTVGAFNRAWSLARRLGEFNTRVSEMLFPTLVSRNASGDHEGFDRALFDTMRYVAFGMTVVAAAGGGAAWSIMTTLFGSAFEAGGGALAVLMLYPALAAQASIQTSALAAVDRPLVTSFTAGAELVVTIALTIPLSIHYGALGAAIAIVAGLLVDIFLKLHLMGSSLSSRRRDLWPPRQALGLLVGYGAGFGTALALTNVLPNPLNLLWQLPASGLVCAAVCLAIGGLTERDRSRFSALARRTRALSAQRAS